MRRMSTEDAELIFRQLRKCNSDEEFRGLIAVSGMEISLSQKAMTII